ncbi:MAG: S-methyl-5'-thioadenosine phosphorylase [Planctomycetota bacterium]|nr:MAG: S-methyl-5'-thioadenosine phosphorylase [Planctomycetota bacterium]
MEITGVIGGSGLYELEGFQVQERRSVQTPFGAPSDELVIGELEGRPVVFLPRHGRGHRFSPSDLPYQANIYALKAVGVTRILSVSAVGSMKEDIVPGHVVLPTQFIDRTLARPRTFFENGVVAHVAFADPICEATRAVLKSAVAQAEVPWHDGGTYICIEGPQFSTRAESELFRSWGVSVIGMTNLPEARLAREAELCYATIALSTDYDCWHADHDDVSVEAVVETLKKNVENAKRIVRNAIVAMPAEPSDCGCRTALQHAVMTDPERIPPAKRDALDLLLRRVLD